MHDEQNGDREPSVGRRGLLRLTGAAAVATTAAMVLPSGRAAATPAGEARTQTQGQGADGSEARDRDWRLRTEQLRANGDSLRRSAELTRQSLAGQTALRIPAGPPR
ncbi:hypothetical protein AB0C33_46030 [Nonomuraea sp. NPDC048881]|uniref:hypothetical protein n=1 Tax=Nonomuraea sp. NPDC048881 TaxID=3155030 RepID=UPI003401848D